MFQEHFKQIKEKKFDLAVFGLTNSGKSTFLHYITEMHGFFNISPLRTGTFFRYTIDSSNT